MASPESFEASAAALAAGYTLGVAEVRTRTTLGHGKVLELLSSGVIPAIRVGSKARWQWRVRPGALEAAVAEHCTPMPLPDDLIPLIEAVAEINGGKRVKQRSGTYHRIAAWLNHRAPDDLTVYRVFGAGRYSRSEVASLKARRANARVIDNRYDELRQRHAAAGLFGVADAARFCQVHPATVYVWAKQELYGAQKIDGAWFFEGEQLAARTRAPSGKSEAVRCSGAGCEELVMRTASQLRHNDGRAYCDACRPAWRQAMLEKGPQAIRDMDSEDRLGIWRKAQTKIEPERVKARKIAAAAGTRKYMADLRRRSHTQYVAHFERMQEGRGTALTAEVAKRLEHQSRSASRKGKAGRPRSSYGSDWADLLADLRDYHERQACSCPDMATPSERQLFLAVAQEDHLDHPERWKYDPAGAPDAAIKRVRIAVEKALVIVGN